MSGDLSIVFGFTDGEFATTAFATASDFADIRLGRALTDAETTQVEGLLGMAAAAIADACGKDLDWAAALDPVPPMLRILSMEIVARVIQNPQGLRSGSVSLGAYSRSGTYADGAGGFALTALEERLARRAVFGANTGSSRPASTASEVYDYLHS